MYAFFGLALGHDPFDDHPGTSRILASGLHSLGEGSSFAAEVEADYALLEGDRRIITACLE
jgi:hypothetical protein